jgi:hypothetical protein
MHDAPTTRVEAPAKGNLLGEDSGVRLIAPRRHSINKIRAASPPPGGGSAEKVPAYNRPPEALTSLPHAPCERGRGVWEEDDAYPCLVRVSDTRRVIICREGIQWILQSFNGKRWRNVSYHRDRDALIERSGATGDALAALRLLPGFMGYFEPVPLASAAALEIFVETSKDLPRRDFQHGPTPGALQGDAYQLDYYDDCYPKLPDFLNRRAAP